MTIEQRVIDEAFNKQMEDAADLMCTELTQKDIFHAGYFAAIAAMQEEPRQDGMVLVNCYLLEEVRDDLDNAIEDAQDGLVRRSCAFRAHVAIDSMLSAKEGGG